MEEVAQEALHASHSVALSIVQAISAALLWIVTLVSYHSASILNPSSPGNRIFICLHS